MAFLSLLLALCITVAVAGCGGTSQESSAPPASDPPAAEPSTPESTEPTTSGLSDEDAFAIYREVLDQNYADQQANLDAYALLEGEAKFALDDLDGNGVKELIVGFPDVPNHGFGALLLGVWTIDPTTRQPVFLKEGRYRDALYVLRDGTLYEHGSSSAWEAESQLFFLEGTKLTRTMDLVSTGSPDTEIIWTYTNLEADVMNKRVDEQTAYDIMNSYAMAKELVWQTI